MRLVLLVIALVFMSASPVSALITTPSSFESEVSHNSIYTEHFRITPESLGEDVEIFVSSPFAVAFSESILTNLSTYIDIDFNITIPQRFPVGVYTSHIFVRGENVTEVINVILKIQKNLNFTIALDAPENVSNGEIGFLVLAVRNTGNEFLSIRITPSSQSIPLYFNQSLLGDFLLYPNLSAQVPIGFTVPDELVEGEYPVNISVTDKGDNLTKTLNALLTVEDNTPPIIEDILFDDEVKAGVPFQMSVRATDNHEIKEVVFLFHVSDNETTIRVVRETTFGKYILEHTLIALGSVDTDVTVTDKAGNNATRRVTLKFERYRNVNFYDTDFIQINRQELFRETVFDSNITVPFCVDIDYLDFIANQGNESYEYFGYIDGVKEQLNTTNTTPCFEGKVFQFAFRTEQLGRLDTEFTVSFDDWVQSDQVITLGGDVGDKTIRRNQEINLGTATMQCEYNGDWNCSNLTYPGHLDLTQLGFPLTEREYNSIKDKAESQAALLETRLGVAEWISAIQSWTIGLFITGSVLYYVFFVRRIQLIYR